VDNNINNLVNDQLNDYLASYAAFGGKINRKNKYNIGGFKTSGLIGDLNTSMELPSPEEQYQMYGQGLLMPGESNVMGGKGPDTFTWANGGQLESEFLDNFSSEPIGAAVRYNQGLERMAAEKEAAEAEAAREAEYNDMLTRIASLETQNQGLQSMIGALSVPQIVNTPEVSPAPSKATDDFSNL
jgi:hypothetical protein